MCGCAVHLIENAFLGDRFNFLKERKTCTFELVAFYNNSENCQKRKVSQHECISHEHERTFVFKAESIYFFLWIHFLEYVHLTKNLASFKEN